MLRFEGNALIDLLLIDRKGDLDKRARETTVHQLDLVEIVLACQTGQLPWLHEIHSQQYIPDHLHLSESDQNAMIEQRPGPFTPEGRKAFNKISETFRQRRVQTGHMFVTPSGSRWHLIYFDQRDIEQNRNHWEHGPHLHLINWLWPHVDPVKLWSDFTSKKTRVSGALHVRFQEQERQSLRSLPAG